VRVKQPCCHDRVPLALAKFGGPHAEAPNQAAIVRVVPSPPGLRTVHRGLRSTSLGQPTQSFLLVTLEHRDLVAGERDHGRLVAFGKMFAHLACALSRRPTTRLPGTTPPFCPFLLSSCSIPNDGLPKFLSWAVCPAMPVVGPWASLAGTLEFGDTYPFVPRVESSRLWRPMLRPSVSPGFGQAKVNALAGQVRGWATSWVRGIGFPGWELIPFAFFFFSLRPIQKPCVAA